MSGRRAKRLRREAAERAGVRAGMRSIERAEGAARLTFESPPCRSYSGRRDGFIVDDPPAALDEVAAGRLHDHGLTVFADDPPVLAVDPPLAPWGPRPTPPTRTPDGTPIELGWKEQRQVWNAAGQCSRQACRAKLREGYTFRHPDSGLLYCPRCTTLIESYNPGFKLVPVPVVEVIGG